MKQILSSQSCRLSIQTIPEEWSETEKYYSQKLLRRCIFYLIANEPDRNNGVKMSHAWVEKICWKLLTFLKSPSWPVWTFCVQDFHKGTMLSSVICVLLNIELFSRNSSPRFFIKWMSVIRNFREVNYTLWNSCSDEVLQENVCNEAFLKKSYYHQNLTIND